MRVRHSSVLIVVAAIVTGGVVWGQTRGGTTEWLTAGGDAQRTSWIRSDINISPESMSKPGFELQWKAKLDNLVRETSNLSQGVTANGVTLFVPVAVVTGSSNNVYAIDTDTGYLIWQQHLPGALPMATATCPGGITAAATRIVSTTPAPLPAPRAGGTPVARGGGGGYRGGIGEPGEGVPGLTARGGGAAPAVPPPPAPNAPNPVAPPPAAAPAAGRAAGAAAPQDPAAGRGARGGGAVGVGPAPSNAGIPGAPTGLASAGNARVAGVVYVVGSDGLLHVLGLHSGKDMQKPAPFLPANAMFSDLIAVNTTLYATTSQSCGGAPNGVWAIDLDNAETKTVTSWKTNGGSIVGRVAFTTSGSVIAAIGGGQGANGYTNAIVALDPKTLELKDWYTARDAEFTAGPVIFTQGGKEIIAAPTKDGRVLLLDASSLGGTNHSTPLFASPPIIASGQSLNPDGLAVWQEALAAPAGAPGPVLPGKTWLLVPITGRPQVAGAMANGAATGGAVVAFQVTNEAGRPALQPAWTSRDIASPTSPIVVNGVVFALASGKGRASAATVPATSARPAAPGAVLYALDGTTGKELWNSGATMTSPLSGRSFWSGNSQLQVGTFDGTIYAFGFTVERR
jgi:outer membrane protein assembly factor BamB